MEINLKNIILWISMLLWVIYILLYTVKELKVMHTINTSYFKYLKENLFKIFRLDQLLLIIVFFLYTRFKNTSVDIYLFFVMMLYFLLNIFYEDIKLKNLDLKKNWLYFLIVFILMVIVIGQYFIFFKLLLTIMLLLCFSYFYPFIFSLITLIFKKNKK